MKKKLLPRGIDNFEKLITRGYYFVDKTLLIKDLLDNKVPINLFTRPRRFGKTLNMSMLQYFFEDERNCIDGSKKDNSYLFYGMNIIDAGEEYTSHMGQYPVINLSLKSAKQGGIELAFKCIREEIANEFQRHQFILENEKLLSKKEEFLKIANKSDDMSLYYTSLRFLSECLELYYGKKVIILIDEYDAPLENAFFEGFYDEMTKFLNPLFELALKTNSHLEFAVITGCLRISNESIFTDFNNLKIISILDEFYDEYFGFTKEELDEMLKYYNLLDKKKLIKEWYNGYIFGSRDVYNPWSVVCFAKDLRENKNLLPYSYWSNISSNNIVKSFIERVDNETTKREIELLIEGKTIEKLIYEDINYDEVYDSKDSIYNFMFNTGYLKKVSERIDEIHNRLIKLAIPNKEVKHILKGNILNRFKENIKKRDLSRLYNALIYKNVEAFEEELSDILLDTIIFNDSYEIFYHDFLLEILSGMEGYIVKSNREGGTGRSDLSVRAISGKRVAVVIEFKVADKFNNFEKTADDALHQIEEKKYDEELRSEGYENIIKYGISFYSKNCLVKLK